MMCHFGYYHDDFLNHFIPSVSLYPLKRPVTRHGLMVTLALWTHDVRFHLRDHSFSAYTDAHACVSRAVIKELRN